MSKDLKFDVKKEKPEDVHETVFDYYKGENLLNYARSKNIRRIQEKITQRALEILNIKDKNSLILDIGCGPGFSSTYLHELGYKVIALDIIVDFLKYYDLSDFNPIVADMCILPFRTNVIDAVISISALQWICRNPQNRRERKNMETIFKTLYSILKRNGRAIFQFYPKNNYIMEKIKEIIITNTDFDGGFIIDNPNNPKKRKVYLFLEK